MSEPTRTRRDVLIAATLGGAAFVGTAGRTAKSSESSVDTQDGREPSIGERGYEKRVATIFDRATVVKTQNVETGKA